MRRLTDKLDTRAEFGREQNDPPEVFVHFAGEI
jgi:hypothetical protein